jgi:DNA-binding MarR family transcriptional regulator
MASHKENDVTQETISSIDRIIHEPARYHIMAYLYVVDGADFIYLFHQTGLTWGNLSTHISKLESAGYLETKKEILGKKPHTMAALTAKGRLAFESYRRNLKRLLEEIPLKDRPKKSG